MVPRREEIFARGLPMLFTIVVVLFLAAIGVLAGYRILDKGRTATGNHGRRDRRLDVGFCPEFARQPDLPPYHRRIGGQADTLRAPRSPKNS
jgi:hypothetical protein